MSKSKMNQKARDINSYLAEQTKSRSTKNFSLYTYFLLVVIRIVLVFVPQYGYIHPDEFFQTSELIAGKTFIDCRKSAQ